MTSKTPPNSQCDGLSRAWASEKMNRRLKSSRGPRHEFHLTQSCHELARTSDRVLLAVVHGAVEFAHRRIEVADEAP